MQRNTRVTPKAVGGPESRRIRRKAIISCQAKSHSYKLLYDEGLVASQTPCRAPTIESAILAPHLSVARDTLFSIAKARRLGNKHGTYV